MTKNVLVTGGAQGIGRAIVESFLKRGDQVFVFDCVSPDDERVQSLSSSVSYIQVDIGSLDSIKAGFDQTVGGIIPLSHIDVLVNNAGITRDMLALRMSESYWDDVMRVNLKGSFFCSQHALKLMIKSKKSYIINIASIVGLTGNPGQANYAASKAGLIAVTKTLAKEYASRNVLVNAIAPGFIQTTMTQELPEKIKAQILEHIPLKRFGEPQDIANMILFLTSGLADYITGQVITIDGGLIV